MSHATYDNTEAQSHTYRVPRQSYERQRTSQCITMNEKDGIRTHRLCSAKHYYDKVKSKKRTSIANQLATKLQIKKYYRKIRLSISHTIAILNHASTATRTLVHSTTIKHIDRSRPKESSTQHNVEHRTKPVNSSPNTDMIYWLVCSPLLMLLILGRCTFCSNSI